MIDNMIDRIARRLSEIERVGTPEEMKEDARAIIKLMRHPSIEMNQAAYRGSGVVGMIGAYQSILDAALD